MSGDLVIFGAGLLVGAFIAGATVGGLYIGVVIESYRRRRSEEHGA